MTKLIRCKNTFLYFNNGQWVKETDQAQAFKNIFEARQTAARYSLQNAEFYYLFGQQPSPRLDWAVPLASTPRA